MRVTKSSRVNDGSLVSVSLVGVVQLGSLLKIIYWGVINGNWGH